MLDHVKETTLEVDGMRIDVEHNTDLRTVVADICTDTDHFQSPVFHTDDFASPELAITKAIDHAVVLGRNRPLSRIITTVE